ncbi:TetR/AcrR family transcriptional regulator [Streptomyces sp. NPDC048109]|uniref:TetR/AcrR family transcriptional regulator n=1 Tax=unclassified Streptomyces TaxID=2593676 RepID=UPI0033DBA409
MAKQQRAIRTREQVLDAAAAEFAASGYAHTTMNTIADRVGMTKGALYGHFPSKRGLAEALVGHGREVWRLVLGTTEAVTPAKPLCALGTVTVELSCRLHADPRAQAAFRLMADRLRAGDEGPNLVRDVRLRLTALVRAARAEGDIAARYPVEAVVELLLAVVFAAQSTLWAPPRVPHTALARDVWAILRDALRPERLAPAE